MPDVSASTFLWAKHFKCRKYKIKYFTNIGDLQHKLLERL